MNYNLKGTNIEITDAMRSHVEKQLMHLDKFFGPRSGARLDIELEYLRDEEKTYRAEATLHDHGFNGDFRVEECGHELNEAVDIMVNTLSLELSRAKKKHIDAKRKGGLMFKNIIRGFTGRGEEGGEE